MTPSDPQRSVPEPRGIKHPGILAWLRLVRVFQKLEHLSGDQLRASGLSPAQFDVLAQVGTREGCTQQELADSLLVTKGNVTQLLDRMEEAGLLMRCPEGRIKRVRLTDAGRQLRSDVVPQHEAFMANRFAPLRTDEQLTLLTLLRTLDRSLDPAQTLTKEETR